MRDNTVIVVDVSNYKSSYSEIVPFKAIIKERLGNPEMYVVESLITGRYYELYKDQVLEAMDHEDMIKLIDLSKYGL